MIIVVAMMIVGLLLLIAMACVLPVNELIDERRDKKNDDLTDDRTRDCADSVFDDTID